MSRCHQLLAGKTGQPAMRGVTGLAASAVSGRADGGRQEGREQGTGQQQSQTWHTPTLGHLSALRSFFATHRAGSGGSQETHRFADGLSDHARTRPTTPPGLPHPPSTPRGRRKLVLPAAAAALVLATAGTGLGYAVARTHPTPSASAVTLAPGILLAPGAPARLPLRRGLPGRVRQRPAVATPRPTPPPGRRLAADRPGADRLHHEVRRRQGRRDRHGAHLRRRGGHQPPRRRGRHRVKVKVMTTGTTYTAKVVGTDANDDVAVLQLDGRLRPAAPSAPTTTGSTPATRSPPSATATGRSTTSAPPTGSVIATDQRSPPRARARARARA